MLISGRLLADPEHPPTRGWIRVEADRIVEIGDGPTPEPARVGHPGALVCPGFVDAHLHLPQVDSIGCDGLELLDWLDRVIFPAESAWSAPAVARAQIAAAYGRMLEAGTLGYAGYLSPHAHAVDEVLPIACATPLRAIVGQSLMDRAAPAALLGQPAARPTRSPRGRLVTSVNPRFAISCSDELLRRAARLAAEHATFVQTHLAESRVECRRVAELFPDEATYTDVYDHRGLLGPRSLLAHAIHLEPTEWSTLAARGCVVVHCPAANTFLRSGLFDLGAAREHGVRLALGSDVAAGPDLAMPRVARAMIEVAKARAMALGDEVTPVPTPAEVWRLITRGNADALGWADGGRLEVGAVADLLVLEPPFEPDEHLIGRLIYTWRDAYITARIVAGTLIDGRP
jgi:guanine deaminase